MKQMQQAHRSSTSLLTGVKFTEMCFTNRTKLRQHHLCADSDGNLVVNQTHFASYGEAVTHYACKPSNVSSLHMWRRVYLCLHKHHSSVIEPFKRKKSQAINCNTGNFYAASKCWRSRAALKHTRATSSNAKM